MKLNESATERLHRYEVMDDVVALVRELKQKSPHDTEMLDELLVRLLQSGGLADPSGDPRLKKA
jgi:hypothetical protein